MLSSYPLALGRRILLSAIFVGTLSTAHSASITHARPDPGLDPTVLKTRAKLTNEFIDRDSGFSKNTTKLNLSHAFGDPTHRDWTIQIDLPVVAFGAGERSALPDAAGLGDIQMRVAHVIDATGQFRWAFGVETQINTAAQPQLGDGIFRLSPILVFAVEPCHVCQFQTTIQFDQSLTREAGVPTQQDLKVKPAVRVEFPAHFYGYMESELKWDFQNDTAFGAKLKFEIGRGFGARHEWVLSARYEMPLIETRDQHTFTVGCSYNFP